MKKQCIVFLFIFFLIPALCGAGGTGETAGPDISKKTADLLMEKREQARKELLSGIQTDDPEVKKETVRMMKYLSRSEVYDEVYRLLDTIIFSPGKQTDDGLTTETLATLYSLDPQKTMDLLLSRTGMVLMYFNLFDLFKVIGFDAILEFDNIFYYSMENNHPGSHQDKFFPLLVAEYYKHTKEEKYLDLLTFYNYNDTLSPEYMFFLYTYMKENKLPLKKIVLTMKRRAGIANLHQVSSRTFSLDELLFQALLYRLKITGSVYKQNIEVQNETVWIYPEAAKKYRLPSSVSVVTRKPIDFPFLRSFIMNDALAYFYAGIPEERHCSAIKENIEHFNERTRQMYCDILLCSPDNEKKEELVAGFIRSGDTSIRKQALAYVAAIKQRKYKPDDIRAMFQTENDPGILADLLHIITFAGRDEEITLLTDALNHKESLVRVAAAGGIIFLTRESG